MIKNEKTKLFNMCSFYNTRINSKLVFCTYTQVRCFCTGNKKKSLQDKDKKQINSKQSADESKLNAYQLTRPLAAELVLCLNDEERKNLFFAMQKYQVKKLKEEYKNQICCKNWRRTFDRPSTLPKAGLSEHTVPKEWLKEKRTIALSRPSAGVLLRLFMVNAIPFIGFGCLDNGVMIIAGDTIESNIKKYIHITTMTAAACGNTIGDVLGLWSANFILRFAKYMGIRAPPLSPLQLEMPICRRIANVGRVIGILVGCFIGMTPLLFMSDEKKENTNF